MTQPEVADFEHLDSALKRSNAPVGAAELHGILCGMLCVERTGDGKARIAQLLRENAPGDAPARESADLATNLHDETLRQLQDAEFGFRLLLPDDARPLSARAEALGDWCRGFLAGLGLAGIKRGRRLPEDINEVLRDFVEISKVDFDVEGGEEDETAYAEIVEYARTGVLLTYQELRSGENAPPH